MTQLSQEEFDRRMKKLIAEVLDNIMTHGVHLTGVFGVSEDPSPPFTYTTGLTKYRHPELVIFGIDHNVAGSLLNELSKRVFEGGQLVAGQVLDDLITNYTAELVEVLDLSQHFGVTRQVFGTGFTVLQVCWPDDQNRFPWDDGFAHPDLQPLLGVRSDPA